MYMAEKLRDQMFEQIRAGEFQNALETAQKLEVLEKSDWNITYNKGVCYRFLGDFDNAIAAYKLTLVQMPHSESKYNVLNNLSIAYQQNGQLDEALEASEKAESQLREELPDKFQADLEEKFRSLAVVLTTYGVNYRLYADEVNKENNGEVRYGVDKEGNQIKILPGDPSYDLNTFHIFAQNKYFEAYEINEQIMDLKFLEVKKHIEEDPRQDVDTQSDGFKGFWVKRLGSEDLDFCQCLLNLISISITINDLRQARHFLQHATHIIDKQHSKAHELSELVKNFNSKVKPAS
jgi:tetratricopeptide (TPR) repeat protein